MSGCHRVLGRLFQTRGPATQRLLSPNRIVSDSSTVHGKLLVYCLQELLLDLQLGERMMLSSIYDGHAAGDTLAAHPSQSDVPDPTVRLATSIRHWIQFSDWYTTLPHVILYTSFEDLVLRLNRTTVDEPVSYTHLTLPTKRIV